ncbi:MAG: mannose-1-phosphate guanylyltransferase [Brevundimonas sp.]|nr:MAG: mannose-1-phosphate guanylyltransferase [Brevundimonas sp.]
MSIFPVILCGGAGTRLWPASRPSRPKQFIDLASDLSLFEETVERVRPLVADGGALVVVAGLDHRAYVQDQLAKAGVSATVLLEPEARDSAAAMAAAAAWIVQRDAAGVALFVASDHHIPDGIAFRQAAMVGAEAARTGRIVTFGVRPTEPSSAYGYIRPEGSGLSPVEAFVEKPDRETAERYMAQGYLWNSGNFIVAAQTLLNELDAFAPEVAAAARAAIPPNAAGVFTLTDKFRAAPRISIDYAVMEKSRIVSVLPVDFRWSDLGAWDAVAATGQAGRGLWIADGDGGNLVRAAEGMVVATAGVSDLAIIAEHDAVLVCHLDHSQEVKGLVERLREMSPGHLGQSLRIDPLGKAANGLNGWIRLSALPLWATLGVDEDGGFVETLDADGAALADFRRARVQARQAYVYSAAGRSNWNGPWRALIQGALDRFDQTNLRADGLYRTRVSREGAVLDDTTWLYDQAFALFAFAGAAAAGVGPDQMQARAHRLIAALETLRHPAGGWREAGDHPHQANAHMHLLEACMAWEVLDPAGPWIALADKIVGLARRHFIDADSGALREFFGPDWSPVAGEDGTLVEPGHQFEWAWLLTRWGRARGDTWAATAATRLYDVGLTGTDPRRSVAIDALNSDGSTRSGRARLWPQTEWLKAALILAENADGDRRAALLADAGRALAGLNRYLGPHGLWRDKMEVDGSLADEAAPASSLYHIVVAWEQITATRAAVPDAFA